MYCVHSLVLQNKNGALLNCEILRSYPSAQTLCVQGQPPESKQRPVSSPLHLHRPSTPEYCFLWYHSQMSLQMWLIDLHSRKYAFSVARCPVLTSSWLKLACHSNGIARGWTCHNSPSLICPAGESTKPYLAIPVSLIGNIIAHSYGSWIQWVCLVSDIVAVKLCSDAVAI